MAIPLHRILNFTGEYAKDHNIILPEETKEFSFDNDDIVFEELCKKGLEERLKFIDESKHEEYKQRLEVEINIIKNMKFFRLYAYCS